LAQFQKKKVNSGSPVNMTIVFTNEMKVLAGMSYLPTFQPNSTIHNVNKRNKRALAVRVISY